jgi:hypothetical protein
MGFMCKYGSPIRELLSTSGFGHSERRLDALAKMKSSENTGT